MKEQINKWLALTKEHFGIIEFNNGSKERKHFRPRAVAMCILSHKLGIAHTEIAEMFSKDRVSVTKAINRVMTNYRKDYEDVLKLELDSRQKSLF